jgi:uncharacterized membrane protein
VVAAVLPAALLILVLWFPLIIYIYFKYDRELKHGFEGKYYRELPGEYTPAEMSVLMSMGTVQTRDIMATLLDLVRKRYLLLATDKVHKKGLFGGRDIDRYTLSINENAPGTALKKHEQYLIDWFVHKIGHGSSVTFDEIEDYVRTRSHALQYRSDYSAWERLVKEEALKNDFFDQTCKKGRIIGVLLGVLYMLLGVGSIILMVESSALASAVVILLEGIILIAFSARISRRTAYGNEQHAMWHAFRNFLKDFSRLDKAVIPSIVIWEHYLVYAVSLGVAKDVIKQLPLVFNDADLDNRNLTFMYGASYGYFAGFTNMFDNTIHTVEGAIMTASTVANSSNSSGGGFGGGFSGGSSGGGGGGGGGGAF